MKVITVKSEIKAAHQKFVIPKENRHNSAFSFGITNFWGTAFISDFTVYESSNVNVNYKSLEFTFTLLPPKGGNVGKLGGLIFKAKHFNPSGESN